MAAAAEQAFSTLLLKQFFNNNLQDNIVFSPLSIHLALGMTSVGASGETLQEMKSILFGSSNNPHAEEKQISEYITKSNDIIAIANKIWVSDDTALLELFSNTVKDCYNSVIEKAAMNDATRLQINKWVEQQTRDKIKDLLAPGILKPLDTKMVLVNAVYFKANWANKFNENQTQSLPFYTSNNTSTNVPMMNGNGRKERFFTHENLLTGLELMYQGDQFSMIFLRPNNIEGGLTQVIDWCASQNSSLLSSCVGSVQKIKDLKIPKFKIEFGASLKDTLSQIGMSKMFCGGFANMSSNQELAVSEVIHKAFIEVNEQGTEAAAATAVVMKRKSVRPAEEPVSFVLDRPFVYILKHVPTNTVAFMGTIVKL